MLRWAKQWLALHHLDHAALHHGRGTELLDALAAQLDAALGDLAAFAGQQVEDRAQGRRLARTIAAQQGHDRALLDLQGNALQDQDHMVVDDLDAVDVQKNIAHGLSLVYSSQRRARRCDKGSTGSPAPQTGRDGNGIRTGNQPECGGPASSRRRTCRRCSFASKYYQTRQAEDSPTGPAKLTAATRCRASRRRWKARNPASPPRWCCRPKTRSACATRAW